MMIFKYGSYAHDSGTVELTTSREIVENAAGEAVADEHIWTINGWITAATQAALTTALGNLEAAYAIPNQDAILYINDGLTPSHHQLIAANTISGVRVTRPPVFPVGRGAEYAAGGYRTFSIELRALYPRTLQSSLVAFTESTIRGGGGPALAYVPLLTGPPVLQQLYQQTTYFLRQRGQAIGYLGYPNLGLIAPPLFPALQMANPIIENDDPERISQGNTVSYRNFTIRWEYIFESPSPFFNPIPHFWD